MSTTRKLQYKCLEEAPDLNVTRRPEVLVSKTSKPPARRARLMRPLVVVHLLSIISSCCHALIQVPNRHTVASIPGDLVLGILVPVHERPSPKQAQTRTCGAVREQYGIQRVEAAFRTIDSINADPSILPNITLGLEIRDSCWHSPIALEQSIEFIRDAMAASEQSQVNINPSLYQQKTLLQQQIQAAAAGASASANAAAAAAAAANANLSPSDAPTHRSLRVNQLQQQQQHQQQLQQQQQQLQALSELQQNMSSQAHVCAPYLKQQLQLQQSAKKIKNLVGVVGPASSGDTVQVQNLLQLFNMPQVGYSATSRDLSNKNFFKYFLRVVPSDKLQARVLIDLMLAYNWTYITVVYTEGSYGSSLMNAFRERADKVGICPATLESMPPNADDAKFDELIGTIQAHPNARVVICMCEGRTIGRLFAAFQRRNVSNEYLIVGSDGWSDRFDVVDQQEEIALGGISIRIHSAYVHDFDDYYFALNPFNNHRNPWFAEFWEQRFQCNLQDFSASQPPQSQTPPQQQRPAFIRPANAKVYNRTCTGRESLRQNHKQDAKMAFVQKSIITMALGLDSMQRALCGPNRAGLCPEMLPVNGSIFLQHLMNVSFSFLDEEVYFDEQGDPPGKYEILNFQRKPRVAAGNNAVIASDESAQNGEEPLPPPSPGLYDSENDSYTTSVGKSSQDQFGPSKKQQQPKHVPKSYNSYSTLKVYSKQTASDGPTSSSADSTGAVAADQLEQRRRRRRTQRRQISPIDYNNVRARTLASESSPTSNYEYIHVGSWKSSDGLSMFGDIHWPSRSSIFHLSSPKLTGIAGPASSNHSVDGPDSGGGFYGQTNGSSSSSSTEQDELDSTAAYHPPISPYYRAPTPQSICSLPCAKGHAKKIQSDSVKCCWVCVPCRPHEFLFTEFKCQACEKGSWPNRDQTGCEQIPIESFDWRSLEALACIGLAFFGLALTLATGAVFIKHNNTPVVKSTTRELSYAILFAMLLAYTNTFFLVARPTKITCFVTRILPGFSFAMLYGALVTKTNRIARILAGSKKKIITRRPCFMSATAQVTITWLIVLIECAIIVAMLWREPADSTHEYPSDERVVLVCNTTTMGIMAPLGFDFFLIAMCTLYAFKTRNVPENFNEAKFIGFTMYTTLVIWIAFVVIYLSSDHKVTTLSLCISFSALFALFLLFFPRCYIIIFKPEKNNRSFFTTIKNVRCHIGYQIGPGSGSTNSAHHMPNNNPTILGFADRPYDSLEVAAASANCGLSEQYNQNGSCGQDALPRATRSRTSGRHRIAPATGESAGELATSQKTSGSPLEQRWLDDMMHFGPVASKSNQQARIAGGSLAADAEAAAAAQRIDSDATHNSEANQATSGPLHYLMDQIRSAFARRSQRKESDKTAVIQQHLRAIRHAENLDRQTNFRRSQVQRLIQRFDSGSTAAWSQHQQQQQQNHLLSIERQQLQQLAHSLNSPLGAAASTACFSQQIREFIGELQNEKFGALVASDDAHQLLAAMGQLIGHDNLWRLASVLSGYCRQKSDANDDDDDDEDAQTCGITRPPLDLRRPSDRRMAMAWLRFLIQMAQRALESVQLVISATCVHSPPPPLKLGASGMGPVALGGGARARGLSLSAQQSRDLITMHETSASNQSEHELPGAGSLQGAGGQVAFVATTMAELGGTQPQPGASSRLAALDASELESVLPPEISARDKKMRASTESGQQPHAASSSDGQWQVSKVDERDSFEPRTTRSGDHNGHASQMSRAAAMTGSSGRALPANCREEKDDDGDPIKRALERITGKVQPKSAAAAAANINMNPHEAQAKGGESSRDRASAAEKPAQRSQHKHNHHHHKHKHHNHHKQPQSMTLDEPDEDQDTRLAFGGGEGERDECSLPQPPRRVPTTNNPDIINKSPAHWRQVNNEHHVRPADTKQDAATCAPADDSCCWCSLTPATRRSRRPTGSATCCHVVASSSGGNEGNETVKPKCHLTTPTSGDNGGGQCATSCRRCCYCSPCCCCSNRGGHTRRARSPRPASSPRANNRKQPGPRGHDDDAAAGQSSRRARPRSMGRAVVASNQATTTETAPERLERVVAADGGTFHLGKGQPPE